MNTWPTKDPDDVLDYGVDWTPRLESGETLLTSSFSVSEGDVDIIDSGFTEAGRTKVWLSGGTGGTRCVILNRVVTTMGRTYDQSVRLRIRSH